MKRSGRTDSERAWRADRLDATATTGLIICGMGGPDGPDAVEPFLRNLFRDPAIFPLPKPLAAPLGWLIARRRAPAVRKRYARISPDSATHQLETTARQGTELARRMTGSGHPTLAATAMRYWHPLPSTAVTALLDQGATQFLIVPMYPQYSAATSGSTLDFVLAAITRQAPAAAVHVVADWYRLAGYLAAVAEPVGAALSAWYTADTAPETCAVLYVAHSLPESFIRKGDPYLAQTEASVQAIHTLVTDSFDGAAPRSWLKRVPGGRDPRLAFQSKVGPIRWLGPLITEEIPRLAAAGCQRLLVQPVSFTCEHVETLYELDIELRDQAERLGITEFRRGPALNLAPVWLDDLANALAQQAFTAGVKAND
jgi:ferrochelatase